jgi:hypothetical protein
MQIVPIQDLASQTLNATLANQSTQLNIYTNSQGLFMDVLVNGDLIIGGVVCQDRNRIVRDAYLGFTGDLCFQDTQGTNDPGSPGLGTRYQLCYLDAFDL